MERGLLFGLCLLAFSTPGMAVFKCVDAEGNVSFSQAPCSGREKSSEIQLDGAVAGKVEARTCELTGLYAEDAAKRMRGGSDYSREIDRYGGTYGARPAMVGLVNYIYSFRANDAAPVRIASLARAKCQAASFGPMAFEDLPVSEYYVYDESRHAWVRKGEMSAAQPQAESQTLPADIAPQQPAAIGTDAGSKEVKRKQECAQAQQQLRETEAKLRAGYSAAEGETLREERREFQTEVRSKCK